MASMKRATAPTRRADPDALSPGPAAPPWFLASSRISAGLVTEPRTSHSLELDGITHRFGSFIAVDDVSLSVKAGELVALLGPSGSGKTTLLRIIAGFLTPTRGHVLVDSAPTDHLPPNRRNVGIVFQNYALFPHMTVAENIAYGLKARGAAAAFVRTQVVKMLEMVKLEDLRDRFPRQLSGGQQQRVALARALAVEPRILLLDEPFGALDKNLRLDMEIEVKQLQRRLGITAVLVTHDQEEAMSMADRIAVLNRGRVEQFSTPVEIYDNPSTLFVNSFVGTTNILPGRIVARGAGDTWVELDVGATLTIPVRTEMPEGARVVVSARPEHLVLHEAPGPERWSVEFRLSMPLGALTVRDVSTRDGTSVKITEQRAGLPRPYAPGTQLYCGLVSSSAASIFAAPATDPP
jgi:putative spermidine/putrescine transport system ATP-binding protein